MNLIFTEHVRALASGAEPTDKELDVVFKKLRDALRKEMQQRGVWSASPSFLGVLGSESWFDDEALDELVNDCYTFSFIHRQTGLEGLLASQENIEGIIFLNIRNFLFERQKQHDPIGYRVFSVLRQAVQQSIDERHLVVLEGNSNVDNGTLLASRADPDLIPADTADLASWIEDWIHRFLPKLITSRGEGRQKIIGELSILLAELPSRGIECFRFKDLVAPLKMTVRKKWTALWDQTRGDSGFEDSGFEDSDDGFVRIVQFIQPSSDFEEREHLQQLIACVDHAIDVLEARSAARSQLRQLWAFLQGHAAGEDRPEDAGTPSPDKLPSYRRIGEQLEIPRYRLPELFAILGQLIERCRTSGRLSTGEPPPPSSSGRSKKGSS